MSVNQNETIKEQYKTADNLNTRISIHGKYSVNKLGFGNWIFSHYDIGPGMKILELGCGTGSMWQSHIQALDTGIKLILTDISEGMLSSAKSFLGERSNVLYNVADIENIPYGNGMFDRVIANMMLYHVPDLEKGLSEVRRTLSDEGIFYCATYGENGIIPYIAGLLKEYGVKGKTNTNFTLQNGYGILKKHFANIEKCNYEDSLGVTNLEDIIDYIYSLGNMIGMAAVDRETFRSVLSREMVNGVLHIPKEYGMFICRK